jgi:hypothetical protein
VLALAFINGGITRWRLTDSLVGGRRSNFIAESENCLLFVVGGGGGGGGGGKKSS